MLKNQSQLLTMLKNRPVLLWGARMTGLGLRRFIHSNGIDNLLGFIDSDTSLHGRLVSGLQVFSPSELPSIAKNHPDILIIITVSIKESEIIRQIQDMDIKNVMIEKYSDYCKCFYTIDIMGSCNLKCPSCAHGAVGAKPDQGRMSKENFESVINKIITENEMVTHVSLYSWGEPFLHKKLPEFIEYLHEKNISVALSTNLSIDNDELLSSVIRLSPDYLKVSLSGFYPDAYNKTHTGGDIRLVKSNMYRLRYLIDKFKSKTYVDVNYHLYRDNNDKNLNMMRQLCKELDFSLSTTYALIMPLERCIDLVEGKADPHTLNLNQNLLVTVNEGIESTKNFRTESCPFKENQININWDLKVPVCCTVFNNEGINVVNDFLNSSIDEINSAKERASICGKCMKYGLPAYNMGFNRAGWDTYASQKISLDLSSEQN